MEGDVAFLMYECHQLADGDVGQGIGWHVHRQPLDGVVAVDDALRLVLEQPPVGYLDSEARLHHLLLDPPVGEVVGAQTDEIGEPQPCIAAEEERIAHHSLAPYQLQSLQPLQIVGCDVAASGLHHADAEVVEGILADYLLAHCLAHHCTKQSQTRDDGVVCQLLAVHPLLIGLQEWVIDIGHQRALAEPLYRVEQRHVSLLGVLASVAVLSYGASEVVETCRRRQVTAHGILHLPEAYLYAPPYELQLHFLHRHALTLKGVVQMVTERVVYHHAALPLVGTHIDVGAQIAAATLHLHLYLHQPLALAVQSVGTVEAQPVAYLAEYLHRCWRVSCLVFPRTLGARSTSVRKFKWN